MSAQDASSLIADSNLVYVSDYFSFVETDEQGHVAFAIDTNRGCDGDTYQAEHLYVVLHDERQVRIEVAGVIVFSSVTVPTGHCPAATWLRLCPAIHQSAPSARSLPRHHRR